MITKRVAVCCVFVAWGVGSGPIAQLAAEHETRLVEAATRGDLAGVRAVLDHAPAGEVNAAGVDGTTALHWAVRADRRDMANLLVRAGADRSGQGSLRRHAVVSGGGERQRRDDPDAARRRRGSQQPRADRRNRPDDGEPHGRPGRHARAARIVAHASTRATPSSRRRR